MESPVRHVALLVLLTLAGCLDAGVLMEREYDGGEPEGAPAAGGPPGEAPSADMPRISIRVDSPPDGLVVANSWVSVQGHAFGTDTVLVDDAPVPVDEDGAFSARREVDEGENLIVVQGPGGAPEIRRRVVRDTMAPHLVLGSPERGLFLPEDAGPVEVTGRAWDDGIGLAGLSGQGGPLTPGQGGSFRMDWRPEHGLSTLVVMATDFLDHRATATRSAIVSDFEDPSAEVPWSISARIGPAALDAMEPFLVEQLEQMDLVSQAGSSGDLEIRYVDYSSVDLDLTMEMGAIGARIVFTDLRVGFHTEQEVLFVDVSITGEAKADEAIITTRIVLLVTPEGGLSMTLEDPDVDLRGFRVDVHNFPGFLEDLLRGTMEDMAEDAIRDAMRDVVVPELFDPAMLHQDLDLLGSTVTLDLEVRGFEMEPDGVRVILGALVTTEEADGLPPNPGAPVDPVPLPDLPLDPAGVWIAVADDFVNRLLFQTWAAGLLHRDVADLAGDSLPIQLDVRTLDTMLGARFSGVLAPDTPVDIVLEGLLPPMASPGSSREFPIRAGIGDLLVHFVTRGSVTLATVAVAVSMDVAFTLSEDGNLVPELQATSVADLVDEPVMDLDDEKVEAFMITLFEALLPMASGQALALPTDIYPGLGMQDLDITPVDGYFLASGRIVPR